MPKWDEQASADLLTALYAGMQAHLTREVQGEIVNFMKAKGYADVHWDSIRCGVFPFLCFPFSSPLGPLVGCTIPLSSFPFLLPPSGSHKPPHTKAILPQPTQPAERTIISLLCFLRYHTMTKFGEVKGDLFEVLYLVTQPAVTVEQREEIVALMQERGHDMGWNAIR